MCTVGLSLNLPPLPLAMSCLSDFVLCRSQVPELSTGVCVGGGPLTYSSFLTVVWTEAGATRHLAMATKLEKGSGIPSWLHVFSCMPASEDFPMLSGQEKEEKMDEGEQRAAKACKEPKKKACRA